MTEEIEVTQADRDAAAGLVAWLTAAELNDGLLPFFHEKFADGIREGVWDNHDVVQAFARHRIATRAPSPDMAEAVGLLRELANAGGTAVHFQHQKTNAMLELESATKHARAFLARVGAAK